MEEEATKADNAGALLHDQFRGMKCLMSVTLLSDRFGRRNRGLFRHRTGQHARRQLNERERAMVRKGRLGLDKVFETGRFLAISRKADSSDPRNTLTSSPEPPYRPQQNTATA